ncbi:follitropin subunit beta-like isoform X1 [Siniperca chuatsi]|uniref:follitropin subunit beta-like isoform X1 n=2 Tax=Siniperca chuatsi TaxID=119488 RepID=UPI001CE107DF|nr:follitropin subunit beta-like isoform X1 [Siniperca chuatsi]XP_044065740.1 follitropin subunit beta-like isoform X1 [Siniperca chuatsi]XP_044065741.1 follitropin subunit beta-like isoform X1 [Siniperca chuatsi]
MSSMPSLVLKCMLLCSLMGGTTCACALKNHTLWIERHDCDQCVAINTTICSGYCYTQDTNLRGRFGRTFVIQRSCVPLSLVYRVARVPGCPQDVNAQLYYPAARRCSCRRCDARTHHCIRTSRISYFDRCTMTLSSSSVKSQTQPASET